MRRFLLVSAIVLAGCGAQAGGPSTVSSSNGPFSAEAAPAQIAAGSTVQVNLTVAGPIQYEAGCAHTFSVWVVDRLQRPVWTQPFPQINCLVVQNRSIAAGRTASFHAEWPSSSSLPPGRYTIHGLFLTVLPAGAGARVRENMPPLTVTVT